MVENSSDEGRVILTTKLTDADTEKVETVKHTPSLFQEYVDKKFEVRSTVIGNSCLSAAIYSQEKELTKVDWKRAAYDLKYEPYELPSDVEQKCVELVRELGLAFGGIDLICTPNNEWYFVEVNPNGQWAWVEQKTGLPIKRTLVDFLAPPKKLRESLV